MIDYKSRARLAENTKTNKFFNDVKAVLEVSQQTKREDTQPIVDKLDKIGKAMAMIYGKLTPTVLPKLFRVKGDVDATIKKMPEVTIDKMPQVSISDIPPVDIKTLPDVKINNLIELEKYFKGLSLQLSQLTKAISLVSQQVPDIPEIQAPQLDLTPLTQAIDSRLTQISEMIKFPEQQAPIVRVNAPDIDFAPIVEAIEQIRMPEYTGDNENVTDLLFDIKSAIGVLANKPAMSAQPVTNINVNALRGVFFATDVTVTGQPTLLPPTNLAHRRTLILYNNSSQTLFLGGVTVAAAGTGKGFPISSGSYSPAFDAGDQMFLYGVVASGTAEVQVLEVSNDNIGR